MQFRIIFMYVKTIYTEICNGDLQNGNMHAVFMKHLQWSETGSKALKRVQALKN